MDLDQPAFPPKVDEVVPAPEGSQPESGEEQEPPTSGGEPVVEEQKVPYSRLKSVIDRARAAEQDAEEAKARLEILERSPRYEPERRSTDAYDGSLPPYWVKMYGDNEISRQAFSAELERRDAIRDEVRQEALEAVRNERSAESQALAQNERTIDDRIEDLSYSLGRALTEDEEGALLDIVDEYTPKDRNGMYAGDLIPMDKAWEIYNLRQGQVSQRTVQKKRTPTSLTSTPTESENPDKEAANKAWNPLDWNSWKKRIPS